MNSNISRKIRRASAKYTEYMSACEVVANEAQKHISWNDEVSCEFYPGDGICIGIEDKVCFAATFFELVNKSEDGMIDENMYRRNCI